VKTVVEVLKLSAAFLAERKAEPARRMAEELLSHVLKKQRIDLYLQFDQPVEERELSLLRELLKRAAKGEPVEYLTGEVEFYGAKIKVDRRVLIPRPETEILADLISKRLRGSVLWDLCTGSGALAISLKKKHPELAVAASDVSAEALALARENSRSNGAGVEFLQGDLFAPFEGRKADVIVSNPPYVTAKEYGELSPTVRDFEPKIALVGGERGVEFYERIARDAPLFMNAGGFVGLEIGSGQGAVVTKIFRDGAWPKLELLQDWAGKDRFFFAEANW
jgi:release factor glutamine methyltransferase